MKISLGFIKYLFIMIVFKLVISPVATAELQEAASCTLSSTLEILHNGSFRLINSKEPGIRSYEYATIDDNTTLHIESGACCSLSTTYTFVIKQESAANHVREVYLKAIELLTSLEKQPNIRENFTDTKKALQSYLNLLNYPELKTELVESRIEDTGFSTIVSIDGSLSENPAMIKITISSGPY